MSSISTHSGRAVHQLLESAADYAPDARREDRRYPFFTPVTLHATVAARKPSYAFSRDLSEYGIGLLHHVPLEPGTVYDIEFGYRNERLEARAEVLWCTEAGEGWYLSGCRFLFDE